VGVAVLVGVSVGVSVTVAVLVGVAVGVSVTVAVLVAVAVGVSVTVAVLVWVAGAVAVGGRGVFVGVGVLQSVSGTGLVHPAPNVAARRCDASSPPSLLRASRPVLGLQFKVPYAIGIVLHALLGIVKLNV